MKLLTFLFAFMLALSATAQDADYLMYETIYLKPDNTKAKELTAAMKHHNDTYHSEAPYSAHVRSVSNGPRVGQLVWIMGPCTFSDLDGRPAGEHDDDWQNNVMSNVKGMHTGEYWRLNGDLSVIDPDPSGPSPIIRVRFHELNKGQIYRIPGVLGKIKPVVEAMEGDDNYYSVFVNEFLQGFKIGRHIAVVSSYDSWAELDEEGTFVETFNEVHGEGSFDNWLREMGEVFADTYDEYWTLVPEMGGPQE